MEGIEKFCPFIRDICRNDCVFRCGKSVSQGITTCLIAAKLDKMNDNQHNDLVEVANKMDLFVGC